MSSRRMSIGKLGVLAGLALSSCGEDDSAGSGTLVVSLEAEETITDGIEPGDGVEDLRDGWRLRFEQFIVTIGDIDVHLSTDESVDAHDENVFVVDLTTVPAAGLPLWEISGLRSGRWDFYYSTPGAADGATRHESVSEADFEELRAEDATYLLAGTLEQTTGQSCPPPSLALPGAATALGNNGAGHACYANPSVSFRFVVAAETLFGPCELDGIPGVAISAGQTQTAATTLHGDHLLFNGFPEADEGGVMRLGQWLADSDLNLDGQVTRAELEAIAPSALGELDARYQLGGSPITPLTDMWQYVTGQLKTQGHMNGEGECPFDGEAHED